jgi:hypothetical protein
VEGNLISRQYRNKLTVTAADKASLVGLQESIASATRGKRTLFVGSQSVDLEKGE